ncbi:MAG: hypothetical protein Q8N08_04015 [Methanobacteriaceae archaeon]|nr:hypothetical protein [Methanobacteriaceae archaeon]
MSILTLIEDLKLAGESYTLQVEAYPATALEDALGNLGKVWVTVKEISGTIQKDEQGKISEDGRVETATYTGFFEPDFEIPHDKAGDYRIKHQFPSNPPFIRYFIIRNIDRNLKMNNEFHHYEMELELARKW